MALELTDQNFGEHTSKGVVLVDFWAPWCGPCRVQGPIVESLAESYKDSDSVTISKMNVDENVATAQKHQILSIPTLIIFKDGAVAAQMIGLQTKEAIEQKLKEVLG